MIQKNDFLMYADSQNNSLVWKKIRGNFWKMFLMKNDTYC